MAKKKAASSKAKTSKATQPSVDEQKKIVKDAKAELTKFLKDNKLKRDGKIPAKHKKEFSRLVKVIEKEEGIMAKMAEGENKKAKAKATGSAGRNTKYDYPEGMDDPEERKKYRAMMRRQNAPKKEKKADSDAPKAKKVKSSSKKKASTEEAPKKVKSSKTKTKKSKSKKK